MAGAVHRRQPELPELQLQPSKLTCHHNLHQPQQQHSTGMMVQFSRGHRLLQCWLVVSGADLPGSRSLLQCLLHQKLLLLAHQLPNADLADLQQVLQSLLRTSQKLPVLQLANQLF